MKKFKEVDTLIIGGGITGISLAGFLENKDYLIIEKEMEVGGYCKTTITDDFVWDYSGHFFHFRDEMIKRYVVEKMDTDIIEVKKKCHIYYNNSIIDFPFQENIHQLPLNEFIECLADLSKTSESKHSHTFKDFVNNSFGQAISKKFIIPYNEKLYRCDLDTLDVNAMGRFFPKKTSLTELLDRIRLNNKTKSYNDSFIYPIEGCFEFVKSLLKRVEKDKILTNTTFESIDLDKKKVYTNNGEIFYKRLISTIPFNIFYEKTTSNKFNFNYNKVAVFNLGFDSSTEIDSTWIYFPGKEIFYRVGFYNNILKTNKMSLYVEISMKHNESFDREELLKLVIDDLKKTGIIHNQKLIDHQFLILNPAYVHITKESNELYSNWSEEYNKRCIYSIGRYGSWTYCSIEDNILEAKKISELFKLMNQVSKG